MSDDCSPCSDEIKETCPDQDAATTSTCDVICDERYRSTPFLDKISTTGTRAPNGKCVYRLDAKPGFVVSDADGQFITLSPCNLLERLKAAPATDNFTFPFLVAVDENGCIKQVMPPETGEYMLPFWSGTEFTWIERSVLLDGCRNGMPAAPAAPLTGLGHLAFVTDTGGEYCVTMITGPAADGGGYVQVDAAGDVTIAALPPQFALPIVPAVDPELYHLGLTPAGDAAWDLNLPAVPGANPELYHLGLTLAGDPAWDLKPVIPPATSIGDVWHQNYTPATFSDVTDHLVAPAFDSYLEVTVPVTIGEHYEVTVNASGYSPNCSVDILPTGLSVPIIKPASLTNQLPVEFSDGIAGPFNPDGSSPGHTGTQEWCPCHSVNLTQIIEANGTGDMILRPYYGNFQRLDNSHSPAVPASSITTCVIYPLWTRSITVRRINLQP